MTVSQRALLFHHDSRLEALVKGRDPDDLINRCDAHVDAAGEGEFDFVRGIELGRLAGRDRSIWEFSTVDTVSVYFVGTRDEVQRRIEDIKPDTQTPSSDASELEVTFIDKEG